MDWKSIILKNPKGVEALKNWFRQIYEPDYNGIKVIEVSKVDHYSLLQIQLRNKYDERTTIYFHVRNLYDFFEKFGIKLFISPADPKMDCDYKWEMRMKNSSVKKQMGITSTYTHPNRDEMEYALFTNAFELLETVLNPKSKYNES